MLDLCCSDSSRLAQSRRQLMEMLGLRFVVGWNDRDWAISRDASLNKLAAGAGWRDCSH